MAELPRRLAALASAQADRADADLRDDDVRRLLWILCWRS